VPQSRLIENVRNPPAPLRAANKKGWVDFMRDGLLEAVRETLVPTPSDCILPRRFSDFATLGEALDYAAKGSCGLNFHDPRGNLARAYPYAELREEAIDMAYRLIAYGIGEGDRVALVAETGPEFAALFFGCIYAGAWPVPLPLPTSFGGRDSYVDQLAVQMKSADPAILFHPAELDAMAADAARQAGTVALDWTQFAEHPARPVALPAATADDIAYLQYSSGSTRFPHGVAVTHGQLLNNLAAHSHGMEVQPTDRCVSWLPWYHDMGLVGCLLSPVANQVSADYLKTEDFARRPLAWLDLISRNPGTTLSYSPTFGYDICARRISSQSHIADRLDLSRWRVAGNGADMIRPDVMQAFVDAFADAGFKASAFLPSYGLAEATLAVSIMPPGEGIVVELVAETELSGDTPREDRPQRFRAIVNCGKPVRDMLVEIRSEDGGILPERAIGKVFASGPSIMTGYFRDDISTAACLKDGWLDTGDMGYMSDGYVYIVGRAKDMIIINGKNHWPQDIEWAVEQLPGFKAGDIAAFAITTPGGEETPAVLVHCRTTDPIERQRLHDAIRDKVRSITGMNCVIELVPPRTLPRTSSGKLSRAKARNLYLSGEIQPYALAA
jgi:fatty-acyl-CoA synthase